VLDAQRAEKISNLEKLQGMARGMEARDVDIGTQGLMSGRTAEEQRARGLGTLATTTSQQQQTLANVAASQIERGVRASEANQQAVIAAKEADYEAMRDTLNDVTASVGDLIAERDKVEARISETEERLMEGPAVANNIQRLQGGQPVEVAGQTIKTLDEYLAFIRERAKKLELNTPQKQADFQRLNERISTGQGRLEQLRGIKSITPSASGI
jgi:chromosome segregation ATPase